MIEKKKIGRPKGITGGNSYAHLLDEDMNRVNVQMDYDTERCDTLWAWVATNKKTGHEGIVMGVTSGIRSPLVATSLARAEKMRRQAELACRYIEVTVTLREFNHGAKAKRKTK